MKNRRNFSISYFICPECNNSFPLPRRKNKERERGHIKDLYCPFCNKVQKTMEIRNTDFYKNGFGEFIN